MSNQGSARGGDRLRTVDLRFRDPPPALADRVLDEAGDDAPGQFVNDARLLESRMEVVDLAEQRFGERNGRADVPQREEAGAQAVVDVVRVIGDVVGDRGRLRLEARMEAEIQALQPIVAEDRAGTPRGRYRSAGAPEASSSGPLCLTNPPASAASG